MFSIKNIFLKELLLSSEFCEKCCRERQQEEISLKFTYTKEGIYIRKVTDETRPLFTLTLNSSKSPTVMAPNSDGEGLADETDDVEVINVCLITFGVSVVRCLVCNGVEVCDGFRGVQWFIGLPLVRGVQ